VASILVVALAIELALCAVMAKTTWALEDSSPDFGIKVTYDGSSLVWSGVNISNNGEVSLDIFSKNYYKDGQVNVEAGGESALVAPGSSSGVNIAFVNATNQAIKVNFEVEQTAEVAVDGSAYDISEFEKYIFQTNVFAQDSTVFSDDSVSIYATSVKKIYSATQDVSVDSNADVAISWDWPFIDFDSQDTFFGNMAAEGNPIRVAITFDVSVEQSSQSSTSANDISNVLTSSTLVQTGDTTPLIWLCVLCALTTVALVACILEVRNDKQVKK
jgi:hypothetical protein